MFTISIQKECLDKTNYNFYHFFSIMPSLFNTGWDGWWFWKRFLIGFPRVCRHDSCGSKRFTTFPFNLGWVLYQYFILYSFLIICFWSTQRAQYHTLQIQILFKKGNGGKQRFPSNFRVQFWWVGYFSIFLLFFLPSCKGLRKETLSGHTNLIF